MTTFDIKKDSFTCHQDNDMVIITIFKGAKKILTTVDSKEDLMSIIETIKGSHEIKGLAIIYSDDYPGNTEYKRFLSASLEENLEYDQKPYTVRYKNAIIQFFEFVRSCPIPIVGGMNGEIGPDSFGLNLAFDLRLATENATFFNPNLQLGFPPSALLSFYLQQSLGSPRATELLLTKTEISPQEALSLGLISQVVADKNLESSCLAKLRELSRIPKHTLVETRSILQPSIDVIKKHLDEGFEGSLRCLYKMKS